MIEAAFTMDSKDVSTHSRPKAAGKPIPNQTVNSLCFNTQPPEGGWIFKALFRFT